MTKAVSYRPAEGRRALHPGGAPLAAAGEPIELTPYWRRLLSDGDIEAVPATKSKPKAKPSEGKPE